MKKTIAGISTFAVLSLTVYGTENLLRYPDFLPDSQKKDRSLVGPSKIVQSGKMAITKAKKY